MSTLSARTGICRAQLVVPSTRAVAPRARSLARGQAQPLRKVRDQLLQQACWMASGVCNCAEAVKTLICSAAMPKCWSCHCVSPSQLHMAMQRRPC